MSGDPQDPVPDDHRQAFRLRAEPPRVTRLSRKALLLLGGTSALAIAAALGYALQNRQGNGPSQNIYSVAPAPSADGLAALPKDYTGLPQPAPTLGPALPGDLGPPILHAQQPPVVANDNSDQQRLAQEQQAALASSLFVQISQPPGATAASVVLPPPAGAGPDASTLPPTDPGSAQNMQDRKIAFVNGTGVSSETAVNPERLQVPVSPYVLQAGSVIPAALVTGLESDLPGEITAQVTQNVYDSPTGRYLLIPQGSRLLGQYDSSVAFGQSRVLLVWTRLLLPDGQSITLERQEGADTQGYSGLADGVNYHWRGIVKAAMLSTVLGIGSELGANNNDNDIVLALREGTADTLNQAGQQIVERQLNIQPTLTIRPGFPVDIVVDQDLVLSPSSQGTVP